MRNTSGTKVRGWWTIALAALLPLTAFADPNYPAPVPPAAPPAIEKPLPANGTILVLPFQLLNPADTNAWVGKSIQESLVADLTAVAADRVKSINEIAPTAEAAIALGKKHGARYVITGGFATVDRELRITGQVLDVETGKAVGALKITGDPSKIFRMEDRLAMQARSQLMPGSVPPAAAAPAADSTGAGTDASATPIYGTYAVAPAPTIYAAPSYPDPSYVAPVDPYVYADPGYIYPYSDYGCGYGSGYGYGIGLGSCYGGYYGHNRSYGRGFNGRGGHNGFAGAGSFNGAIRGGSSFRSAGSFRSASTFGHAAIGRSSAGGSHSMGGFHSSGASHSFGGGHASGGGHGGGHR